MSSQNTRLIRPEDSVLVLIDFQERLLPVIHEREACLANAIKLASFAKIINLPVVVTEQNKLGGTVKALGNSLGNFKAVTKISFDCFGEAGFAERLDSLGRNTLILAGIEAHICVAQTALSALGRNNNVHLAADAVSSRTPANKQIALKRLDKAGAVISSTEMIIYELLAKAGTPEFKETLKLVK